jgi:hypothetical protein
MMHNSDEEKGKYAYEKPRLRVIELAAEEVLGIPCKANPTVSAKAGQFPPRCGVQACSEKGS